MKYNIQKIKKALENTPMQERYRAIVRYRLGLDDMIVHTLEETGKMFGLTRERIRQIEVKTIEMIGGLDKYLTNKKEVNKNG